MAKKKTDIPADLPAEGVGHNSNPVVGEQLRSYIERFERLAAEKDDLTQDQREVMAEAKSMGFDTKAMRALIRLRKMDPSARAEEEAVLDLYKTALGMD